MDLPLLQKTYMPLPCVALTLGTESRQGSIFDLKRFSYPNFVLTLGSLRAASLSFLSFFSFRFPLPDMYVRSWPHHETLILTTEKSALLQQETRNLCGNQLKMICAVQYIVENMYNPKTITSAEFGLIRSEAKFPHFWPVNTQVFRYSDLKSNWPQFAWTIKMKYVI